MQGHIHKRVHTCRDGRATTRWYVIIEAGRARDGRRRQQWHGGFLTRREAEVARARLVSAVHNRRYVARSSLSLQDWVQQSWLPMMETRVKPSTLRGYRQMMDEHVLPALGETRLQKLTPLEVAAFYAQLVHGRKSRRPPSLSTVINIHRALHKALADAVDYRLVEDNVASRAKPPRPSTVRAYQPSTWLPSELASFLSAVAADRLGAVWRLAAMTGMRRGELLGLRWDDIDLDRARLSVHRAFVDVNYEVVESTPKGIAARTIDLDWRTVMALDDHLTTQRRECQEWGDAYERNDLVAAWQNGSLIHPQAFSRMFRSLVERADLRRIRLHDLRHTHATLALQAGVPVTIISERLGHHSPGFTLKQYAHAVPGMQAAAAAAVAELVESPGENHRGPQRKGHGKVTPGLSAR